MSAPYPQMGLEALRMAAGGPHGVGCSPLGRGSGVGPGTVGQEGGGGQHFVTSSSQTVYKHLSHCFGSRTSPRAPIGRMLRCRGHSQPTPAAAPKNWRAPICPAHLSAQQSNWFPLHTQIDSHVGSASKGTSSPRPTPRSAACACPGPGVIRFRSLTPDPAAASF